MKTSKDFIMKPKIDFCFKELMADEDVRHSFISALLNVPIETIGSTTLQPTELHRESKDDKLGILDVHVLFDSGTEMDIEIQIGPFAAWPERSLYYLCRMFAVIFRQEKIIINYKNVFM